MDTITGLLFLFTLILIRDEASCCCRTGDSATRMHLYGGVYKGKMEPLFFIAMKILENKVSSKISLLTSRISKNWFKEAQRIPEKTQ